MNQLNWPELDWEQWQETADTLHMFMQIVGKTRLALTPTQNHWWNVPLYVTATYYLGHAGADRRATRY